MRPPVPIIQRFLNKIKIVDSGCWEWQGWVNRNGYCHITLKRKGILAHRFIFMYYYNNIDSKMTIHHKCYNRKCVNPIHLEQMSYRENILHGNTMASINAQKTHCPQGHEYTSDNTYINSRNSRVCKICERRRVKNNYDKLKKQVPTPNSSEILL